VSIAEEAFAEGHPTRMVCEIHLSEVYARDTKTKETTGILQRLADANKKVLVERHSSWLYLYRCLGDAYLQDGQLGKGIQILEEVCEFDGRILTGDLLDKYQQRWRSLERLAIAYLWTDDVIQVKKAIALLQRMVAAERRRCKKGEITYTKVMLRDAQKLLRSMNEKRGIGAGEFAS
jgi:hypothetical protein